jgi:hypothetical protein
MHSGGAITVTWGPHPAPVWFGGFTLAPEGFWDDPRELREGSCQGQALLRDRAVMASR